jgi:site-specific recombinase XerD
MINRNNYKLTREFLEFKKEINQLSEGSIQRYKSALNHFLIWLDDIPIEDCTKKYPSFPTYLQKNRMDGGSKPLAFTYQKKILQITKQFLQWVKMSYPHQFKKLNIVWVSSLQVATSSPKPKEHEFVTLEEVTTLATRFPPEDLLVYKRDQAAAAMLFLSGMRASAFASLPIKAVDVKRREIKQWPSLGVRTKFHKHATTYLLDIPMLINVVAKWDTFIRTQLPDNAMWYPIIISEWSSEKLSSANPGKNRNIQLAKRLRKLSKLLTVEYKSPHKYRHGHAVYALLQAKNMADYKAISQNLMHGSINVTDSIYAWLNSHQIKDRIAGLSTTGNQRPPSNHQLDAYLGQLSKTDLKQAIQKSIDLLAY